MKDGHYIGTVTFGNTKVELRGYGGEIDYAYIGNNDITEMVYELDLWQQFSDAYEASK